MAGAYENWSQQQLIARIQELEKQIGPTKKNESTVVPHPASSFLPTCPPDNGARPLPYRKAPKRAPKAFDASKYSTRLIALKFAYLGQRYNGFEHHKNNSTPLPTVEEELWKALVKTRLINPIPTQEAATDDDRISEPAYAKWDRESANVNWDGCEYSKCGRTDRGVSAFGQVIGVRVRSNKPLPRGDVGQAEGEGAEKRQEDQDLVFTADTDSNPSLKPFNDLTDELPYIQHLNRVLPPDIRIYAWCPNPPPGFDARFSCKERRYKYFFTNPAFAPVPGAPGIYNTHETPPSHMREGWLDIDAMKAGCQHLIGLHDFRNLCKIDASKQLTNFQRRIFHADIEPVSPLDLPAYLAHQALQPSPSCSPSSAEPPQEQPQLYAFTLHGSAFLWHQVRSIIAILFLIGQRLESPSLIPSLLDPSVNPTRPKYEMASDAPLVLWDCIFPHAHEVQDSEEREHGYEDRLEWIYVGDEGAVEPKSRGLSAKTGAQSVMGKGKWGRGGVVDDVWEMWRERKVDETLAALLLDRIAGLGKATLGAEGAGLENPNEVGITKGGPRVFDGGNIGKTKGAYVPVLKRERQETVEVVNERYRARQDGKKTKAKEDGDE